jgi:DNA-binding response OmpR family regulator
VSERIAVSRLQWGNGSCYLVVTYCGQNSGVVRVLVVEDHKELAATIALGLRREGMAVDIAFDGQVALGNAARDSYDVIVLDRDLPKLHGDDVCRALVARGSRSRVLMLTAADTIEHRVDGLGLGADDYLPKPFAFAELVARIRALARRSRPALPPVLVVGDIRLDTVQRSASRGGRRLELSPKELAILELLLSADGAPVSSRELLSRGWDQYVDPDGKVVKVTISRLRRKLGHPPVIETVPHTGYRISA